MTDTKNSFLKKHFKFGNEILKPSFTAKHYLKQQSIISSNTPKKSNTSSSHLNLTISTSKDLLKNSFMFSRLTRFDNTIVEKFKSNSETDRFAPTRLGSCKNQNLSKRFKVNKDMSRFTPENKQKRLSNLSKSYNVKKLLTQMTKNEISSERLLERKEKFEEKFRRLEIRQKKIVKHIQECQVISKSWAIFYCVIKTAHQLQTKFKIKKSLKAKNFRLMRKFKIISKCVGRLIKILQNSRLKSASFVLKYKFLPRLKSWMKKVRRKKLDQITSLSELILTKSFLFSLMAKWKFIVILI